jgi:hypothetical protein
MLAGANRGIFRYATRSPVRVYARIRRGLGAGAIAIIIMVVYRTDEAIVPRAISILMRRPTGVGLASYLALRRC